MKRILLALFTLVLFIASQKGSAVYAQEPVAGSSAALSVHSMDESIETDFRVEKLKSFLQHYNSPLTPYAKDFVEQADIYQLDWRWVVAITGVESTFGKHIPYQSYNAYGWANGEYAFTSWEESIETVTKALAKNYVGRGADTIEKIAPIYAPPSTTWAGKVLYFIDKIDRFSPSDSDELSLLF